MLPYCIVLCWRRPEVVVVDSPAAADVAMPAVVTAAHAPSEDGDDFSQSVIDFTQSEHFLSMLYLACYSSCWLCYEPL